MRLLYCTREYNLSTKNIDKNIRPGGPGTLQYITKHTIIFVQIGLAADLSDSSRLEVGGPWMPGCWRHIGSCDQVSEVM